MEKSLLTLTKPFVPMGSRRFGYFVTNFCDTAMYCSDTGYSVCIEMSVRNTCTISRLAFDVMTPVSMARWTLPEKLSRSGILNDESQSDGGGLPEDVRGLPCGGLPVDVGKLQSCRSTKNPLRNVSPTTLTTCMKHYVSRKKQVKQTFGVSGDFALSLSLLACPLLSPLAYKANVVIFIYEQT